MSRDESPLGIESGSISASPGSDGIPPMSKSSPPSPDGRATDPHDQTPVAMQVQVTPARVTHDAPSTHEVAAHDLLPASLASDAASFPHPASAISAASNQRIGPRKGTIARIVRARLAILIAFVLLLVGCAREPVLLLTQWTFVAPDGVARPVTLPTHLDLPDAKVTYSLRTSQALPPELVGQRLTLAFVRLPAIARLRANGVECVSLDPDLTTLYRVSGAQRWVIPAELTRSGAVQLDLDLEHRFTQSGWIDSVPRLSATSHGDVTFLAINTWNNATAFFGMAVVVASGLSYMLIFLLDRTRKAHAWFVLEAAGGIAFPAFASGLTQPFFGTADAIVMGLQLILGSLAAVAFVHAYYGIPFRVRPWLLAWLALAVISLATSGPFTTRWFAPVVTLALAISAQYQILLCWRLWHQNPRPRNVLLVALAWPAAGIIATIEFGWWLGLGSMFRGVQGGSAAISIVAFMRIAALSREHVRSLRKTDHLLNELSGRVNLLEEKNLEVERLNEELRRQIAARSAQLADALARIGARHAGVVILDEGNTVAGRYRVVRPIASGGMGSVYEVERMKDSVPFALKVLHGRNEPLALARFAREAQIAAQIDHPNVVSIVDMDVDSDGFVFLVMELVRGVPLNELRDRFGDLAFAVPVLRQIAEGLAAIHDQGIVHRDLKPANVLVIDPDGAPRVKITDFGVAMLDDRELPVPSPSSSEDATRNDRLAPEEPTSVDTQRRAAPEGSPRPSRRPPASSTPLTRTGVLVGTPMYMAPELLGGGRYAKPASDIFGLGVVAYLVLTGEHPFPERRTKSADVREAPSLAEKRPDLPRAITDVVQAALSIDPGPRPDARTVAAVFAAASTVESARAAG
jgi:serine/threonine-protein kinase